MAALRLTSLSVGKVIRKILTEDGAVKEAKVTKVFPVVTDKAILPYIAYRRASVDANALKGITVNNADTTAIEVVCFTEDYESGVALAEAVRNALDGRQAEVDGLRMRSCILTNSEEAYQDDAYLQKLVFTIKAS